MNHDEIMQIIPAPAGMYAKYAGEDNGEKYESYAPIVCLALIEDQLGRRCILPMDMDAYGLIEEAGKAGDFERIVWKEYPNE